MAQTWLPGDTRQRIQDLIKDSSITQAELAGIIGLSESALSRYLKGQTEMLGDGYIIKIAKHFNVSTDFLLGETDIPDRKNYDIEELGLSAESAKLLYTGKIDSGILNLLIENPKFTHLIRLLAIYKDETMLDGIRAANQNYTFLRSRHQAPFSVLTLRRRDLIPKQMSHTQISFRMITKNPEHLFIRKETITEVRNALGEISDRERAYLHYRYGFVDDMSHDQTETASHFHLSLSRARHMEKAALNNVRRALPGQ